MGIHMVKVRARIEIGSLRAGTPPLGYANHILSFNVDKSRGKISTFSASLKVKHQDVSGTIQGDYIKIYAGTSSSMPKIYTGIVKTATIGPCREDPGFVILNIGGEDVMSILNGKKFTRRCRSSKGVWVSIESIVRPGLRSGHFQYVPGEPWMETTGADVSKVGQPTQTAQIPNISKNNEKAPPNQSQEKEVAIDITYISKDATNAAP